MPTATDEKYKVREDCCFSTHQTRQQEPGTRRVGLGSERTYEMSLRNIKYLPTDYKGTIKQYRQFADFSVKILKVSDQMG